MSSVATLADRVRPVLKPVLVGAGWLLGGAVFSRIAALLASYPTARILGPEAFGQFGLLQTTLGFLQLFATVGVGAGVTAQVAWHRHAHGAARASMVVGQALRIAFAAGTVATGALAFFAESVAATLGSPALAPAVRALAVGLLFSAGVIVAQSALLGFKAYGHTALLNAVWGTLSAVLPLGGARVGGVQGAIWALAASHGLALVAALVVLGRIPGCSPLTSFRRERALRSRLLISYGIPGLLSSAVGTGAVWITQTMLARQPGGYGQLAILNATNVWYTAMLAVPGYVVNAGLPLLSEALVRRDRTPAPMFAFLQLALNLGLTALPALLLMPLASYAMALYGPAYGEEGGSFRLAIVTSVLVAATSSLSNVLVATQRLWLGFLLNAGWAGIFVGCTSVLLYAGATGLLTARLIAYAFHVLACSAVACYVLRSNTDARVSVRAVEAAVD